MNKIEVLNILERAEFISAKFHEQLLLTKFVKFGEEMGELCSAILCKMNTINKSDSSTSNIIEEAIDVGIVLSDIIFTIAHKKGIKITEKIIKAMEFENKMTSEDIINLIHQKLSKWESKVKNKDEKIINSFIYDCGTMIQNEIKNLVDAIKYIRPNINENDIEISVDFESKKITVSEKIIFNIDEALFIENFIKKCNETNQNYEHKIVIYIDINLNDNLSKKGQIKKKELELEFVKDLISITPDINFIERLKLYYEELKLTNEISKLKEELETESYQDFIGNNIDIEKVKTTKDLIFLGTGHLFSKRNFDSNFLIVEKNNDDKIIDSFLYDCGTMVQLALNHSNLSMSDIHNVFISHDHPDHIGGLEELCYYKIIKREKLNIYYKDNVNLKFIVKNLLLFNKKYYNFITFINLDCANDEDLKNFKYALISAYHCNGISYGLYFTLNHKKIFITGDMGHGWYNKKFFDEKINEADIIIADCFNEYDNDNVPLYTHNHWHYEDYKHKIFCDENLRKKVMFTHLTLNSEDEYNNFNKKVIRDGFNIIPKPGDYLSSFI